MRARTPDRSGTVVRDGYAVAYEVYGECERTLLILPTLPVVDSRGWQHVIAPMSRHHRVVLVEPRGRGESDPSVTPSQCIPAQRIADAIAVMDATATTRASILGLSMGGRLALLMAAEHPERVDGVIALAPGLLLDVHCLLGTAGVTMFASPDTVGDSYLNADKMMNDYEGYLRWFIDRCVTRPYASKLAEDTLAWGLGTTPEVLLAHMLGDFVPNPKLADLLHARITRRKRVPSAAGIGRLVTRELAWSRRRELARLGRRVRCPVLLIHGNEDVLTPLRWSEQAARTLPDARVEVVPGEGHFIARPALVNQLIEGFLDDVYPAAVEPTQESGRAPGISSPAAPRVLYLSSPIGLGHARRDAAIVDELRRIVPAAEVEWLAQDPVSRFLDARDETLHPASRMLVTESTHLESETQDHDLYMTEAMRRMDEILLANFAVFLDVVREGRYDLVVGDEAWEVDHFLHEEPGLKSTRFAWLTDLVGALPMPDKGQRDVDFTAEWNAQMVDHVRRNPSVRDLALFIGDPDDVLDVPLGPHLPSMRDWTCEHYDFAGFVTGFDPTTLGDRESLRAEFGYGADETICIAAVGGSGVGTSLLRRVLAAHPLAAGRLPGLRTVLVTGPRIDPDSLPDVPGVDKCSFIPDLHRRFAACDFAIVQGGLTTTMELTAAGTPFLYVPLLNHFEQQICVPHRLQRHHAGKRLDYASETAESVADAMVSVATEAPHHRPVPVDGAARAARKLVALL